MAFNGSESAEGPLINFLGEVLGGAVHAFGHRSVDKIDDEFACGQDVGKSIFGAVGRIDGADGERRRVQTADVEVAERGEVGDSGCGDCADKGDGSGGDESGHEIIDLPGVAIGECEAGHGVFGVAQGEFTGIPGRWRSQGGSF